MTKTTHHMRCYEVGSLVKLLNYTWKNGKLDGSISIVFKHTKKVICIVVEGDRSNKLVETKRGKNYKYKVMTLSPEENLATNPPH